MLARLLIIALAIAWPVASQAQTTNAETAIERYLDGLQALSQGDMAAAESQLAQAVALDDEQADLHLALGVSRVLQEKPSADEPLTRVLRLDPRNEEVQLWRYAADQMFKPFGQYDSRPPYEVLLPYTTELIDTLVLYGTLEVPGERDEARVHYPALAAAFARQQMARPLLWPPLLKRAKTLMRDRDFDGAWQVVEAIRPGHPDDPDLLYLSASCRLYQKDYAGARAEYTTLLEARPDFAYALLGRARAAALMGDADRARRDFAAAERIDAKSADAYRASVMPLVEKIEAGAGPSSGPSSGPSGPSATPGELLARLAAGVQARLPFTEQIELAVPLVRLRSGANWNRDEAYADRVGDLKKAVAAAPSDADALAALAGFYLRPLGPRQITGEDGKARTVWLPLRDEWRESGGKTVYAVPWVFRGDPSLAKPLLDQALKLQPQNHAAIRQYALMLRMRQDLDGMQPFVLKALGADPVDLDMARLYLDYNTAVARNLNDQASALRTPRITHEDRADGRYEITTYPSQADLARANTLDSQAQDYRRQAIEPLTEVGRQTKTDPSRIISYNLANAVYYHWIGELGTSAGAIDAALKVDPYDVDAIEMMIDLATGTHTPELRDKWQGWLDSFMGTSARVLLRPVFTLVEQTRYRSALEQLDAAEKVDPGSSLIPAYRTVALEAEGDRAAALAAAQQAMALEGGKARIAGLTLVPGETGPLSADDAGLSLLMRLVAARALTSVDPDAAVRQSLDALTLADRVPQAGWDDEVATTDMPGTRKGGLSLRDIVIAQHELLTDLLAGQGQSAEAARHRQTAASQRQQQIEIANRKKFEEVVRGGARR